MASVYFLFNPTHNCLTIVKQRLGRGLLLFLLVLRRLASTKLHYHNPSSLFSRFSCFVLLVLIFVISTPWFASYLTIQMLISGLLYCCTTRDRISWCWWQDGLAFVFWCEVEFITALMTSKFPRFCGCKKKKKKITPPPPSFTAGTMCLW